MAIFKKMFNYVIGLFAILKTTNSTIEKQTCTVNNQDVFGNILEQGDAVVEVLYNEKSRRGYLTIPEDFDIITFDKNNIKCNYVKYHALLDLMEEKDKVKKSRKRGYLHVMMA